MLDFIPLNYFPVGITTTKHRDETGDGLKVHPEGPLLRKRSRSVLQRKSTKSERADLVRGWIKSIRMIAGRQIQARIESLVAEATIVNVVETVVGPVKGDRDLRANAARTPTAHRRNTRR